ncbi:MAG: 2-(1,2-epoxy-1,2-dihydrophenyl)acetyl-CoA isomerase PaaG [Gammaproteobacteria bacterium]
MSWKTLKVEQNGPVSHVTLNRPEKLNSVTAEMRQELVDLFASLQSGSESRVVVLTGAGRAFCTGQDLNERYRSGGVPPPDLGEALEEGFNRLVRLIRALPIPVVCRVNGVAAGAGANLALACDLVVAGRSARFIQSFTRVGLMPDTGGSWFLPRRVGLARAAGLALLAEPLSAEQAEAWGLIWRCVDDAQLDQATEEVVGQLLQRAPLALAAVKQGLEQSFQCSLDEQLDFERDRQQALGRSSDYREGVAAFMEKRAARFEGK